MSKILFMLVLVFVADSLGQNIILPTWRPPTNRVPIILPTWRPPPSRGPIILPTWRPPPSGGPIIRTARAASDDQPLWLYQGDNIDRTPATGDHPYLPQYIDDIKLDPNRRYARSVDSPSARRSSGSHSSSGSHDTGPTHPGYNRRNARSLHSSGTIGTPDRGGRFNPRYQPSPTIPEKPTRFNTYA